MKKQYTQPKLTVHGNVERITMASGTTNRDSNTGPNNTAFPNA